MFTGRAKPPCRSLASESVRRTVPALNPLRRNVARFGRNITKTIQFSNVRFVPATFRSEKDCRPRPPLVGFELTLLFDAVGHGFRPMAKPPPRSVKFRTPAQCQGHRPLPRRAINALTFRAGHTDHAPIASEVAHRSRHEEPSSAAPSCEAPTSRSPCLPKSGVYRPS